MILPTASVSKFLAPVNLFKFKLSFQVEKNIMFF